MSRKYQRTNNGSPRETANESNLLDDSTASQEDTETQRIGLNHMMSDLQKEVDADSSNESEEADLAESRISRELTKSVMKQKKVLKVGKKVGAVGNPSQMVQDARLTQRINFQTIAPIKNIKVTPSIWSAKEFSRKLRLEMAVRCFDPEEFEDKKEILTMDELQCRTFVDEFANETIPGLVPNLTVVHGALDVVIPKPKPKPSQPTQKIKPAEREKPQMLKKLQAAEMDASVDPTMQRVGELYEFIQTTYGRMRKPFCVMSLLVDPYSFQKTVERFFCFSFLLKDAKVRMFLDEHHLPVCTPVEIPKARSTERSVNADGEDMEEEMEKVPDPTRDRTAEDKFQIVMMNLTEDSWKELVKAFKDEEEQEMQQRQEELA